MEFLRIRMVFTLVTSYAIIRSAGAHVSATAIASGQLIADISDKAESQFCEAIDYDLITNYATIADNLKPVIAKAVACVGAMDLIAYDPTGYLSNENQLILDVLNNSYEKIVGSVKNRAKQWAKFGK